MTVEEYIDKQQTLNSMAIVEYNVESSGTVQHDKETTFFGRIWNGLKNGLDVVMDVTGDIITAPFRAVGNMFEEGKIFAGLLTVLAPVGVVIALLAGFKIFLNAKAKD